MPDVTESSSPSPEDVAHHAMQACSDAFAKVRTFSEGVSAQDLHAAWVVLHDDSKFNRPALKTTTWIRHAAMETLIGLGVEARSGPGAEEEDRPRGADQLDEAWRSLAASRLDDAVALVGCRNGIRAGKGRETATWSTTGI
jgi:hypothetical protein